MATRLAGSSDLYQASGRQPYHSINFVTSHDGYTLNDLVAYERKHNLANGEDNRDGDNNNYSANYGVEGPTRRLPILRLRRRQAKNFLATLMLSQGVPMVVSGDEVLRTQRGNNNAYCQDNATSWFDWRLVERNAEMLRFTQALVDLRLHQPVLRREDFLTGRPHQQGDLADVSWYGVDGKPVDWNQTYHSLVCLLGTSGIDHPAARHVLLFLHSGGRPQDFKFPVEASGFRWRLTVDTAAEPPADVFTDCQGPVSEAKSPIRLDHHSLRCYVSC